MVDGVNRGAAARGNGGKVGAGGVGPDKWGVNHGDRPPNWAGGGAGALTFGSESGSFSCLSYSCGQRFSANGKEGSVKKPLDAEVLAPWVEVRVAGTNDTISVSNQSSRRFQNKAVIKSFQYGQDNGSGVVISIMDEEGGAFHKFFTKMMSNMSEAGQKYQVIVQFGWQFSTCNGGSPKKQSRSSLHHFLLIKVDVKFDKGYTFVLQAVDQMKIGLEGTTNVIVGTDKEPVALGDALDQLFAAGCPPAKVQYHWRNASTGKHEQKTAKEFWKQDYKRPYDSKGLAAYKAAKHWISMAGAVTKNDKGVRFEWHDTDPDPTIAIWEDGSPKPSETVSRATGKVGNNHLGTYIVNGGYCSPVIEFNPQVKWSFMWAANTGGHHDRTTARGLKQKDHNDAKLNDACQEESRGGLLSIVAADDGSVRIHGTDNAGNAVMEADSKHTRANRNYEPITAELRIQGDPTLDHPFVMKQAHVSLIVINPFFLQAGTVQTRRTSSGLISTEIGPAAPGGCPEWVPSGTTGSLANSTCNESFSNFKWYVFGIHHDIKPGSYTTTLKLTLPAPGSTIDWDKLLGGNASGARMQ